MKRKEFIKRIAAFTLLGLPVMTASNSCSKEEQPAPSNNNNNTTSGCLTNGTNSSISSNHGHSLTLSKEDVENAFEKTYSIKGSAGHDHMVTITSSEFETLKNNQSISATSTSSSGHTHNITVSCA